MTVRLHLLVEWHTLHLKFSPFLLEQIAMDPLSQQLECAFRNRTCFPATATSQRKPEAWDTLHKTCNYDEKLMFGPVQSVPRRILWCFCDTLHSRGRIVATRKSNYWISNKGTCSILHIVHKQENLDEIRNSHCFAHPNFDHKDCTLHSANGNDYLEAMLIQFKLSGETNLPFRGTVPSFSLIFWKQLAQVKKSSGESSFMFLAVEALE